MEHRINSPRVQKAGRSIREVFYREPNLQGEQVAPPCQALDVPAPLAHRGTLIAEKDAALDADTAGDSFIHTGCHTCQRLTRIKLSPEYCDTVKSGQKYVVVTLAAPSQNSNTKSLHRIPGLWNNLVPLVVYLGDWGEPSPTFQLISEKHSLILTPRRPLTP